MFCLTIIELKMKPMGIISMFKEPFLRCHFARKETIKFELGLTISVGVSFNKIFAKLGSDMKKPYAVTVIPQDTFREKIWGLPAADLLGVGRATQRVLDSYCIKTIGDLAKTDPDFLKRKLGKNGTALWQYANGNDHSRVTKTDFVSNYLLEYHQTSFLRDYSNRYWWVNELEKLYQAAMSLSDEEKELVTLYVFDGYTQQEIADKFHCSQMAISKRLRKIKKAFLPAKGGNAND